MSPRILILACIPLLLFGCSGGKSAEAAPPKEVRVMTYNIHHANPPSQADSIDLAAIVQAIASQKPDLVALQEVDVNTKRSGLGDQAAVIAQQLGMYSYFGKAIDFNGGEFGTAILSRYPITDTITYLLPDVGGKGNEPRVLTTARVLLPSGENLIFASTHLDHRGKAESRKLQIREILKLVEGKKLPWILAGDLNAKPDSEEIQLLGSKFGFSCTQCPNTFPAGAPDRIIDYIAFYPRNKMEPETHLVVEESYASDHRPVFAVLRMKL